MKNYNGKVITVPCLHDRYSEAGLVNNEYFWQDLMVARWIFNAAPERHLDVGSRVDGFIAHLASFRSIELLDIRPLEVNIPGVTYKMMDIMGQDVIGPEDIGCCDSLSCLHALEHFGLGRYGDQVNPLGYKHGIANMASLLKTGGKFYLSTPVGRHRVEFNANWIFDPIMLTNFIITKGFTLETLHSYGADGFVQHPNTETALKQLSDADYNLGIFIFRKS